MKETAANPGSVAVGFVVGTVAMKASVTSQTLDFSVREENGGVGG